MKKKNLFRNLAIGVIMMASLPACSVNGGSGLRFTRNGDGTVTDNMSGLIWLQDLNDYNRGLDQSWEDAVYDAGNFSYAGYEDWRLPDMMELQGLLDFNRPEPALPDGHPFTNVREDGYWTSDSLDEDPELAWLVFFGAGIVSYVDFKESSSYFVWPVRNDR